jgi:hypothetical protein
MGETHVLQKGWGYWDTTVYPYGGDFHRASSAFGVKLLPDRQAPHPDEAVVTCPGEKGLRTLVTKRGALVSIATMEAMA